jgi:D-inositol-3-phosphate glycosyltransferase
VPPQDPEALAARAAEMLRDPGALRTMGRNAILRVNGQFTWRKVTRSIASLYEQVLAGRAPRPERFVQQAA